MHDRAGDRRVERRSAGERAIERGARLGDDVGIVAVVPSVADQHGAQRAPLVGVAGGGR